MDINIKDVNHESRCFDCLGENSCNTQIYNFHKNSFLNNKEVEQLFSDDNIYSDDMYNANTVIMFNKKYEIGPAFVIDCQYLFNSARKNVRLLHQACKHNTNLENSDKWDFFNLRNGVSDLFYYARKFMKQLSYVYNGYPINQNVHKDIEAQITSFRLGLQSFIDLPEYVYNHSVSKKGNLCTQPAYHLFHGHLEWRWHHLVLTMNIFRYQNIINRSIMPDSDANSSLENSQFEKYLVLLICDLFVIAIGRYEKMHISETLNTTPFPCSCVKEIWVLIQLLIEKLHSEGNLRSFWSYVNDVFTTILQPTCKTKTYNCSVLSIPDHFEVNNPTGFSIWMLMNIAKLQGFDARGDYKGPSCNRIISNHRQLETLVRMCTATDSNVTEIQMRVYIQLMSEIITAWWEPKPDEITLFWEHFHKKINSSFYIQGSAPDTIAVTSKSALGLLTQIKQRLDEKLTPKLESSYVTFLQLIGKYFKKCYQNNQRGHWQRMKGRIYPKFSQNKLIALSETGVLNFVSLFLTLAVSIDVQEICTKLQQLLSEFPFEQLDPQRKLLIMKTHLAVIILYVENKIDISESSKYVLQYVTAISNCNKREPVQNEMMHMFVEGLQDVIECSQDFQMSEFVLIDFWTLSYLNSCSPSDQFRLLEVIMTIMSKLQMICEHHRSTNVGQTGCIQTNDHYTRVIQMVENMFQHILPFVRQNAIGSNSTVQIADLATQFTLLAMCDPKLCAKFNQDFVTMFKFFVSAEAVDIRISQRYVCQLLSNNTALMTLRAQVPNFELMIIQVWIKCCILNNQESSKQEIAELFRFVHNFEDIRNLCSMSNIDIMETDDYLFSFMNILGQNIQMAQIHTDKVKLSDQCHAYFAPVEKYVIPYMKNPTSLKIVLRIYSVIAVLFLHCAQLIYTRSKPTCLLHILLTQLILPPALHMGKNPHSYVIAAVRKTWHLFIKGLLQLDYKNDSYIQKAMKDFVVLYIPYFSNKQPLDGMDRLAVAQPLSKFLLSDDTIETDARFVLDSLANLISCRGKQIHSHAATVMGQLHDLIQKSRYNVKTMGIILSCIGACILEQIMFLEDYNPCKQTANLILDLITKSSLFKETETLQHCLTACIKSIVVKHLAFSANYCFSMLHKLTDLCPRVVEESLPVIKAQISTVETMRGLGYDAALRNAVQKLETYLASVKMRM